MPSLGSDCQACTAPPAFLSRLHPALCFFNQCRLHPAEQDLHTHTHTRHTHTHTSHTDTHASHTHTHVTHFTHTSHTRHTHTHTSHTHVTHTDTSHTRHTQKQTHATTTQKATGPYASLESELRMHPGHDWLLSFQYNHCNRALLLLMASNQKLKLAP